MSDMVRPLASESKAMQVRALSDKLNWMPRPTVLSISLARHLRLLPLRVFDSRVTETNKRD